MRDVRIGTPKGLLTRTGLRGIDPATAEKVARHFHTIGELFDADPSRLRSVVSAAVANALGSTQEVRAAAGRARDVMQEAERRGVCVLTIFDCAYPEGYRAIPDRPPVVFVRSDLPRSRLVTCIGTRQPSQFGEVVSDRLVRTLVAADWTIVSGLAIGVDTLSHKAALLADGRTVAVMAGGLDSVYPKQNAKLADEIVARGGALVSEQPFGVLPSHRNLVHRDRLQSGLSSATFVVQTSVKGGSMHTVRFTVQQGRLLFAAARRDPLPAPRRAPPPRPGRTFRTGPGHQPTTPRRGGARDGRNAKGPPIASAVDGPLDRLHDRVWQPCRETIYV